MAVKIRSRVFEIVQYEKNRLTGEDLGFNEEVIKAGILKRERGLKNWAYIKHDKDVYIEGNDIPEGKQVGDPRENHWHVLLEFNNQAELDSVAKAFGVSPNFVEKKTGAGAFYDCLYYLVHEDIKQRELGKHVYERTEVVMANSDVAAYSWETVDTREEKRIHKLPMGQEVENYIKKISQGKLTLAEVFKESPVLYSKNLTALKIARREYLATAEPPVVRMNYYMQGLSGTGKTTAAIALARSIYPDVPLDKLFFIVSQTSMFEGYDGQKVLIWDDWRAEDILELFGRGMAWKIFAIHPQKTVVNVKYSSVNLINSMNIVTAVTEFKEFMRVLADEYTARGVIHKAEDPNQGYRRFPAFISVDKESYELYVSRSFAGGELDEYFRVARVEASLTTLASNVTLENQQRVMEPVVKSHYRIEAQSAPRKNVQSVEARVKYDDASDQFIYAPEGGHYERGGATRIYYYSEQCKRCGECYNRETTDWKLEGKTVLVEICSKCKDRDVEEFIPF